jgi:uncharacterized protein YfdQ (DUF2303 family)
MSENESNVAAAIDAVERLHTPRPIGLDGQVVALPKGMQVVDLKPHLDARRERPERTKGTAKLTTLVSFIDHVRRFADRDSAVFAIDSRTAPKLVAVFDYHEEHSRPEGAPTSVVERGGPRFGEHRAEYAFPLSDAWKAWNALTGKWLPQADFAAFLEERIGDVVAPEMLGDKTVEVARELRIGLAGADDLMTLSRGLSVRVDAKVTQAVNLSSGESTIGFEETHRNEHGGPVRVPSGFAVSIPVFRFGAPYAVVARLRYRIANGAVVWAIQLQRADECFDHAFTEACDEVRVATSLPLFFGTPEA